MQHSSSKDTAEPKLLLIPGACHTLGGTLITLSSLIKGFAQLGRLNDLCVFVQANSQAEHYLMAAGQRSCIRSIVADREDQFFSHALRWVHKQPIHWPLLLDNTVQKQLLPSLLRAAPILRQSGRPTFHFCHDLASSYHPLGYWGRRLPFWLLSPQTLCNSRFTAEHIYQLMPKILAILYQPIDTDRFSPARPTKTSPPPAIATLRKSGARILLTPSRITQPGQFNDKNLRAIIPLLACLKAGGHNYHSIILGEDQSEKRVYSHQLLDAAEQQGVRDRLTILPPQLEIENYYRFADLTVTLAPREPFGRTVVESIACGTPVIGSNTGGIGEILRNFAVHWTASPDDAAAAAAAVLRLANASDTSETLQQGQRWIQEHCNLVKYASQIIQLTGLNNRYPARLQVKG
ncbi:MAG: glycosyltransferase family 4 protein [Leptolyngbyaceae cyanobacterium MAG.088]|nr:glycosyltransferase family 4 protein [Leptolyngbyaceae cyanobacterium MAG.088]